MTLSLPVLMLVWSSYPINIVKIDANSPTRCRGNNIYDPFLNIPTNAPTIKRNIRKWSSKKVMKVKLAMYETVLRRMKTLLEQASRNNATIFSAFKSKMEQHVAIAVQHLQEHSLMESNFPDPKKRVSAYCSDHLEKTLPLDED